jgi:hypothetical protein
MCQKLIYCKKQETSSLAFCSSPQAALKITAGTLWTFGRTSACRSYKFLTVGPLEILPCLILGSTKVKEAQQVSEPHSLTPSSRRDQDITAVCGSLTQLSIVLPEWSYLVTNSRREPRSNLFFPPPGSQYPLLFIRHCGGSIGEPQKL